MAEKRFFTDEDIYGAIAPAQRRSSFDAVSTPEAGRTGETDQSQLEWATNDARVFVTFNVAHFANLPSQWMTQGRHHAGVVVSVQRPIGDLLNRLLRLRNQLTQEAMQDRLEFLSNW